MHTSGFADSAGSNQLKTKTEVARSTPRLPRRSSRAKSGLDRSTSVFRSNSEAQRRLLSVRREPLFLGDWDRALMIHFAVNVEALQREVPYPLDLFEGRAFVSLVAFTLRHLRPRFGGLPMARLFRPIATHDFLNVRTYVRVKAEPGIHFLAEWLSNRLAVYLGPRTFALPYRHGLICYDHDWRQHELTGCVEEANHRSLLSYTASIAKDAVFAPCNTGSRDEWLMERYTAFNAVRRRKCYFRVWHPPWPQCQAQATIRDDSLLLKHWPWFQQARLVSANFSPGVNAVWMGRPQHIQY